MQIDVWNALFIILIILMISGIIACKHTTTPFNAIRDYINQEEAWRQFLKNNGIVEIKSTDTSVNKKILHLTNIFLTKNPKFIHIILERARLYERENNYSAAENDYIEYLKKFPKDEIAIDSYTTMICMYKGKEFTITTLENFYRKIQKKQFYYSALASIYNEAGDYDSAIRFINKAIHICPNNYCFYSQRAIIHLKNNNIELYQQDIQLSIKLSDNSLNNP